MVDFPSTAKFLTPEEKNYVMWTKSTRMSSAPLTTRHWLTSSPKNTTRPLLGRRNTSKLGTSSWPSRTGSFGSSFYSPARSLPLVGHTSLLFQFWSQIDELSQFTGSRSSYPRSSMGLDIRLPFRRSSPFLHMSPPVSSCVKLSVHADDDFLLAIVLLFFAHFSDKLRLRWPFIFAGLLCSAAGFAINLSDASVGAKYFGTFLCVIGAYSCVPGSVAW